MARRSVLVLVGFALLAGSATAAATKAGDPQKRHNAADQAWAERMRIQRSDLGVGDWRVEPHSDNDHGAPKQCKDPNLSDLVETGGAEEPDFSRNGSFVSSGSIVFQTEAQMRTAFARIARTPLTDCLIWAFKQGASGSGTRVRVTSAGPIRGGKLAPMSKTGRVDLVVTAQGVAVKGHFSYYLLARGRASVILMFASFERPLTPIPASLERRLAAVVAARLNR
jgi:hypothetical protein